MKSFVGKLLNVSGGALFVNPGTGPVNGASLKEARKNIKQLIIDAGLDPKEVKVKHYSKYDDSGRFFFRLSYQGRTCEVEMPGLELEKVRYIDKEKQNIWDFPRLYVDGSSWVWMFAINCVKAQLSETEEDRTD